MHVGKDYGQCYKKPLCILLYVVPYLADVALGSSYSRGQKLTLKDNYSEHYNPLGTRNLKKCTLLYHYQVH